MNFQKTFSGFVIGVVAVCVIIGGFVLLKGGGKTKNIETAGTQAPKATQTPTAPSGQALSPEPTPTWKTYSNQTAGFSLQYPSNWTADPTKDYIGFKSDEWVKDKIQGDTVTVTIFKNTLKEKILHDSGFQAAGEVGSEGLGSAEYTTIGSAAEPPVAAQSTRVNGMDAISADVDTRLYGGTSKAFIGMADAKNIVVFGAGIAANIWIVGHGAEFDHILSTFKFLPGK